MGVEARDARSFMKVSLVRSFLCSILMFFSFGVYDMMDVMIPCLLFLFLRLNVTGRFHARPASLIF